MDLKDKTFVVTGGGSGLGRQLTIELVKEGANVAAIDINEEVLVQTVKLAGELSSMIYPIVCNITDKEAVNALPERVLRRSGHINCLINNAGIIQPFVNVEEMDDALINRIFAINFFGTLYMVRAFLPHMRKENESCLVNVSSLGGFVPVSGQTIYGASKAAVKQLTDGLRAELDGTSVHVMSVIPGAMATPIRENSGLNAIHVEEQKTNKVLDPMVAAHLIVEGIKKKEKELYIGADSRLMHNLFRFIPLRAAKWLNDSIRRQHAAMEAKEQELLSQSR